MSEDINSKIQQVAELLGQDNLPENVKSLLSMLAGSMGGAQGGQAEIKDSEAVQEEMREAIPVSSSNNNSDDLSARLKKALNGIGNVNDPRINLLLAVKPFMNNNRQKKISNCIQLLQFTSITKMLNNQEK